MSEWKAGMSFDSVLQTPLDFYDVTYANGHKIRYEIRKRGEWKITKNGCVYDYECSCCGFTFGDTYPDAEPNFCERCGSDNRKEQTNE